MTNIKIFKDSKENYTGIEVKGHTDTDVCNAISTLSQTLAQNIININDVEIVKLEYEKYIDIQIKPPARKMTRILLNNSFSTICTGFQQLKQTFPDKLNLEFCI